MLCVNCLKRILETKIIIGICSQGPIGPPGLKGNTGERGPRGKQGPKGMEGKQVKTVREKCRNALCVPNVPSRSLFIINFLKNKFKFILITITNLTIKYY